ncbi:hypothetical protein [Bradyrhizobium sp. STM 3843]|uniref:hypothetical protein n=1 Tax=Bradyrhizobium sp. STM 3843 TaxID=551947 RepID=UPI001112C838|nr:hypothetical protein [Bradyrhizobium sp. STM 3843]
MFEPRWRLPDESPSIVEAGGETGAPIDVVIEEPRDRARPLFRVLMSMQLFTSASIALQLGSGGLAVFGWIEAVNFLALLGPIILLLLARRSHVLMRLLAFMIVPIFLGRLYYGPLYLSKTGYPQMGDWALWINFFFGYASLCFLVLWSTVRLFSSFAYFARAAIARSRKGS